MNKYLNNTQLNITIVLPFVLAPFITLGLPAYLWLIVTILSFIYALLLSYKPAKKYKKVAYWYFAIMALGFASIFIFDWWLELAAPIQFVNMIGIDGAQFLLNDNNLQIYYVVVPLLVVLGDLIILNATEK